MFLLGCNKHLLGSSNIQGKFIALKPGVHFFQIIVYSPIQLSHAWCLVAETGVVSIHGHIGAFDSRWYIIDIDKREKGSKKRALRYPQLNIV